MEREVSDLIGEAVGMAAREGIQGASRKLRKRKSKVLSGPAKVAAGAGLVVLTPLVAKLAGKAVSNASGNVVGKATDSVGKAADKTVGKVTDTAVGKVKENVPAPLKAAGKVGEALGGGKSGGKSGGMPGVGKGRRMPVQQDIDIGAPLSEVYNEWTQFEEWPKFMHRLQSVSQEDETNISFKTKIWGISKEFKAEIDEQVPDERIKWHVADGPTHSGVVTFHELGPRLTRVEVSLYFEPGSLIEKAGRGMRHVKRAVRADMARFKAYVLMQEDEPDGWRGTIEDGDVKPRSSGRSRSAAASSSSGSSRSASSRSGSRKSSSNRSSSNRASSKSNGSRASSKSSGSRASSKSNGSGSGSGSGSRASSGSSRSSGSKPSRSSGSKRTRGASNGGGRSSSRSGSGSTRSRSGSHK